MISKSKKKKILLFFPSPLPYERSWHGVPLALLAISRVLDKKKYQINIYARHLQDKYIDELIANGDDALCLGISAMTGFQIQDGLKMAKLFKKKYPHIPIIWGGWHPSILPNQTVKNSYVDIVVRGQGDLTFPELVESLYKNKSLKSIKGITYKHKNKIYTNPDRAPSDLSLLPPLPYHLIDVEKCIQNTEYGSRTIPYISSYGCPHRCAFCVEEIVNKRRWRPVPAKTVLKEWQNLIKKYHADSVAVYDSNFFVDEKRVTDICQGMIKGKINLKWGNANGRAGQLSRYQEKTWKLMEKTGCAMILTGAESGSQSALDFISKDMNLDELINFTKKCEQHHIKILYSFLVGLPWSKDPKKNDEFVAGEYKATLGLIDKLLKICNRNRYTYYIFLPYPGAALFNRAVSLGLKYPKSLNAWSNYLMSPENAFHETLKQKWISAHDAKLTAMLTQYIFGIMDRDTFDMLYPRIKSALGKISFRIAYYFALLIVKIRWRLKFFDLPLDYWVFSLVHRYGGIL